MEKKRGPSEVELLSKRINELAGEKQKFQDLVEGSVQGIMIHRKFRLLFGNQSLANIFGYSSPEEMQAMGDVTRIIAPEELPRLKKLHLARLRGESPPSQYEFQGVRKDGTRISVDHHSRLINWEGKPAVQTTLFDLSERKQSEEDLRASRRLLQTVLDTIPHWVFVKDRESRFMLVNSAFANSHNARAADFDGVHTIDITSGKKKEWQMFLDTDQRVLDEGERVELPEYTVTLPDGKQEIRHVIKLPLLDDEGNIVGLVGVSEDITEIKGAEEELRKGKGLLDTILDNIPSGLSMVDRDLKMVVYNRLFNELLDFPEDLAKQWSTFEEFIHYNAERGEYGQGDVEKLVRERVELAKQFRPHKFERRRPDGRYLEIRGNPLPDGGFVTTYTDVSDRKEAEEALRESEQRFRNLIDTSLQGVYIHDKHRFLFVNKAFADLFGYDSPEKVLAIGDALKFYAPAERKRLDGYYKARISGEGPPIRYEFQGLRKDGSLVWLENLVQVVNWQGKQAILATVIDITDRKKAEDRLQSSQRLLRTVIDTIPHPIYVKDLDHRFNLANHAMADLFNLTPSEIVGMHTSQLPYLSQSEKEILLDMDRRVIKTKGPVVVPEVSVTAKDGQRIRHICKLSLNDSEGNAIGILGVSQDITERILAEKAIRESEERIRAITDAVPVLISYIDKDHRFRFNNKTYLDWFGKPPQAMEGKHVKAVLGTVVYKQILPNIKAVLSGQEQSFEMKAKYKDGGERFVQAHYIPHFGDGNEVLGFYAVIADISERKQAEDELRASREAEAMSHARLMDAIESLPASFALYDANDRHVLCNKKTFEMFPDHAPLLKPGVNYEKIVRMSFDKGLVKFDPKHKEALIQERLQEHRNVPAFFEQEWSDGRWFEIHHRPTADGGIVSIRLDITARKRIEQELAEERQNLEKMVTERTEKLENSMASLEDSNLQLQEANLAKARFLSSMSHELRTPLNGILGFSELLRGQHFGELNEKQLNYVDQIESSGTHLLSLINDLLDMAKIDAGGMEIELEAIDVMEFLKGIAAMMDSQFKKNNVTLKLSCDSKLPPLYADSRKCRQIMLNLLSNAVKFTPGKGRVEIRAKKNNRAGITISVKDNGFGIEKEDLKHIFSKYHQARKVRDEQFGGIGIGLALSKRLVELHGGEIGVKSVPGLGSTFWFEMPLRKPPGVGGASRKQSAVRSATFAKSHRILVVEDNEVNLALILDILSIHSHVTVVARNGLEAIDLAKSHGPELILMDVRMPVMDGMEATRKLREMPEFKKIPIIALTASTGSKAETRQLKAGFTEHLAKPIQTDELFAILKKYLD